MIPASSISQRQIMYQLLTWEKLFSIIQGHRSVEYREVLLKAIALYFSSFIRLRVRKLKPQPCDCDTATDLMFG